MVLMVTMGRLAHVEYDSFGLRGVYKTAPSDVVASINPNFLELEKNPAENEVFATFLTSGVTDRTETLIEGDNIYQPRYS